LLWQATYAALSKEAPGLFGSVTARAEAHTARLAMMFALLDLRREICVEHLEAALALWRYCEASARYIFGDAIGNAMADEILRALRQVGHHGMTPHRDQQLVRAQPLSRSDRRGTGAPSPAWQGATYTTRNAGASD